MEEKRYTLIYADGVKQPVGIIESCFSQRKIFEDSGSYTVENLTNVVNLVTANKVTQLVMKAQNILEKTLEKESEK